ncbi:MAG: hypothetical protein K8M05_35925, partial [Deltaproteobacteria bacterium]|nr:hypothetical protein [Kofleriaceae bacterium]
MLWAPALVAACAAEPATSTQEAESLWHWPPDNCPEGCGDNAASVGDGLVFHRLDQRGEPNGVGLRLVGMRAAGMDWDVEVTGDRLSGVRPSARLSGGRLVGAELLLLDKDGVIHTVVIAGVRLIPYWVGGGETWTYRLMHRPVASPSDLQPLCTTRDEALQDDPGWEGMNATETVIFTGDHYDAIRKTVEPQPFGWFNIACAGSAMAKLHLLRHTEASSDPVHRTDFGERQSMFKMITADVCGTGRPFTSDGERLFYMDAHEWTRFDPANARSLEAIWNRHGAVCLDEPRRLAEEGPDLLQLISDECERA